MLRPSKAYYLAFTKKERGGTIALLCLALLTVAVPVLWGFFFRPVHPTLHAETLPDLPQDSIATTGDHKEYQGYGSSKSSAGRYSNEYPEQPVKLNLFPFDPNTLDPAGWQRLGLPEKNIRTISNFVSKGGKFKAAGDIRKIWGLKPAIAEQLVPYIRIAAIEKNTRTAYPERNYTPYTKTISRVDINSSDSADWEALPAIGPAFARRIINFRKRLGGFISVQQIAETYGLPDSTYQAILPYLDNKTKQIKIININTATLEDLKAHPYIRYQIGNAIIQYRTQHGSFSSVQDLKKIMIIDDDLFQKIFPYLATSD